ncbi:hypothetical protein [Mycobacteroides chelonae]|uniref:hypothetical protein n=1 Tax=Mycobacteroides chelonae TaxID=1774 RepID=UPI0018E39879|nr:hypothetical protein [Mycobacteroides chelonae]
METQVNFVEWANAVDRDHDTTDDDLLVAIRIANGESVCTGCIVYDDGLGCHESVPDLEMCENCESASLLEELGFLISESRMENGTGGMVIYDFRIPPKLYIEDAPWITAYGPGHCMPYITVKRDLSVREDDERHKPIWEFLSKHGIAREVARVREVEDPAMESGRAIETLYQL